MMLKLVQNMPKEYFKGGPNMKQYLGAMPKDLLEILSIEDEEKLPLKVIPDKIEADKFFTLVRHFESDYNDYKNRVRDTWKYQMFMKTRIGFVKKILRDLLLKEYRQRVDIDYNTKLSANGRKQAEKLGLNYAKLIEKYPEVFPTLILVSPYLRTRQTIYYLLKHVKDLNINLGFLIEEENNFHDMVVGTFRDKHVCIKLSEDFRERVFGTEHAPSFIRKYDATVGNKDPLVLNEWESFLQHYYTSPQGGEAQTETNQRVGAKLDGLLDQTLHKNIMIGMHHLAIISAVIKSFGGTERSFYQVDNLWKPTNGSFTFLAQIPETEMKQENRLRLAAYNFELKDEE